MAAENTPLAIALGLDKLDAPVAELLQERLDIIRHKLKFLDSKPSVLFIGHLEPLTTGEGWMPELIGIAGGVPAISGAQGLSWQQVLASNPEVIIIAVASLQQTMGKMGSLLQLPGFGELKAVKNNRIYMADGERFFNQPGAALIDALEMLAEMIHPKQFIFGNEGEAWARFEL